MNHQQHLIDQHATHTRREFLNTTASGLGMAALGAMLTQDGLMNPAAAEEGVDVVNPLAPRERISIRRQRRASSFSWPVPPHISICSILSLS